MLKNIYHLVFYFIKHCGLHWRTIWPLMNPPKNIPFWGPQAMHNPLLKLNLKTIEKLMHFIHINIEKTRPKMCWWVFEAVRGLIPMRSKVFLKAQEVNGMIQCQKCIILGIYYILKIWPQVEDQLTSNEPPYQYTFLRSSSHA